MENSKIQQKKTTVKEKGGAEPLLCAALSNKNVLKAVFAVSLAKTMLSEYTDNVDFYHDLIKFNLGSRPIVEKVYDDVYFHDLPPEVEKTVARVYRLLKDCTAAQIYEKLNLSSSTTNRASPVESKWVYHYCKVYGTTKYLAKNIINDELLLKPLNDKEYWEYRSHGF